MVFVVAEVPFWKVPVLLTEEGAQLAQMNAICRYVTRWK